MNNSRERTAQTEIFMFLLQYIKDLMVGKIKEEDVERKV